MLKKIAVGLVVLVALGIAGFGIYYVLNRPQQSRAPKIKIIEVPTEEAKNYIRLIYESKGKETASESLYNIDKLDGKLDKPHIVVKYPKIEEVFHMASKMEVAKELELIFIDKNDKILKKIKYVNTPYMGKMNVWFSKNRKIAIVFQMRRQGAYWHAYDQKGDLLWKQEGTGIEDVLYPTYVSPDGEYIVMTDGDNMLAFPGDISKEAGNQVVIFDKHLKIKIAHKIKGYKHFGNVIYSPSGDYFIVGGIKGEKDKIDWFIFNREGKLISKLRIGGKRIKAISDDGYIFTEWEKDLPPEGGYPKSDHYKTVFNFKGKKIWDEKQRMALINDGKRFYYQRDSSASGKIIIDAVSRREILSINGEEEGYHFTNFYFPLAYSKGKPVLFRLKAQKLAQDGRPEIDLGEVYLLIKNNTGLLIRFKNIFPEDIRGASYSLALVDGEIWGDKDTGGLSKSSEEDPYSGFNCIEVKLNE